jgi:hypothetical protein
LGNTTSFTFLNVGSSDFIEEGGFTGIDMAQNGADGASKLSFLSFEVDTIVSEYTAFLFLFEFF